MLLAFRHDIPPALQNVILGAVGGSVIKRLGTRTVMVNVGSGRVMIAVQALKALGEITYSEPDYASLRLEGASPNLLPGGDSSSKIVGKSLLAPTSPIPNDPYLPSEWAVQNTGQSISGIIGTPGADQKTAAAWAVTTGTNSVVVAVLDSGVQYSHPDLLSNMWSNPGGVGGCSAGTHGYNVFTGTCDPMDDDTCYGGHGSHVAGILGAIGNNGAGVAGVNWTTSIMAVKWVNSNCGGFTSDLITAMDWVIQAKQSGINIRVVNDSATWPGTAFSQALSDEIDLLGANDILFVTAAGNTAQNNDSIPRYPCSYNRPNMICAAATDENDNLSSTSNFGPGSVHLTAAGVDIFSTKRTSNYGYISGCSMSAAQVSGAAALVLSRGYLTVANLRSTILANVDPLPNLTSVVATGGRLNICKAVPGCLGASSGIPNNTALPIVSGTPQLGSLISASTGMWTGVPTSFSYQWYRCSSAGLNCTAILGATAQTYGVLAAADVGSRLAATVTASNANGSASAQSSPAATVSSVTSPFKITSTIVDGHTIGGSLSWQATPSQAVNFVEFYIDGALSQTDFASSYVYNQGTTNIFDSTALSNGSHVFGFRALSTDNKTYGFYGATITVANPPLNIALPVISGSALQGQLLTTTNGTWTNSPTTFTYRWNRCNSSGLSCAAITGATSNTYLVSSADVGSTLRAVVTAINTAGSNTATSTPTAVVLGALSITTASLPNGQQNSIYSAGLVASGGPAPYTWTIISGALPLGVNLAAATGVISGTPVASGTANFIVQVKDANNQTATKALSILISAAPAVSLLQSKSATGSVASSLAVSFQTANTAGNLIIAFVRMSSANQTVSIIDTNGNTYTDAVSQVQTADGHQIHLFYAQNITGGANTVTARFSSPNSHAWLAIYEYSGLSPTSSLDRTAAAQGSGASPSTGPTAITTSTNELVFTGFGFPSSYSGTVTAVAGYSLAQQNTTNSRAANETQLVSAAASYTGNATLSTAANWSAVIATFAAASGPLPPVITTGSLQNGQLGVGYIAGLGVSGGLPAYTWSVFSGALPPGLNLAPTTGVISGTPTAVGTSSFTIQVKDANSLTATRTYSITIAPLAGPIALVQSNSVEGTGLTVISSNFGTNNTAGNLIIAFIRMSSTNQTVNVVDTAGNVFVDAVSQVQATDGHQVHVFYARNIVGGPNTVTAAFSATNNHPWLSIFEYSGLSTTSPLDRTAANQGGDAFPTTGPTAITTGANELIFAGAGFQYGYTGVVSAGGGFTLARQDTGTSRSATETAAVSSTGTYTGTFTLSDVVNWSAVLATFKQ